MKFYLIGNQEIDEKTHHLVGKVYITDTVKLSNENIIYYDLLSHNQEKVVNRKSNLFIKEFKTLNSILKFLNKQKTKVLLEEDYNIKKINIEYLDYEIKGRLQGMINICFSGGPSTGKSTAASDVFVNLKKVGLDVENITEFAKDLTYGKDFTKLSDQLYILGEQRHRLLRIQKSGEVTHTIQDSPFIIGLIYSQDTFDLPFNAFENMVIESYLAYNNINIILERDIKTKRLKKAINKGKLDKAKSILQEPKVKKLEELNFQQSGRNQDLEESIEKDIILRNLYIKHDIPYITLPAYKAAKYATKLAIGSKGVSEKEKIDISKEPTNLKRNILLHKLVINKTIDNMKENSKEDIEMKEVLKESLRILTKKEQGKSYASKAH